MARKSLSRSTAEALGPIVVPLFGFNLGIELGQILVLSCAAVLLAGIDRVLSLRGGLLTAYRWRVLSVSAAVLLVASRMAVERRPW